MSRGARMTLEQVSRLPQAAQRQIHDQLYSPVFPASLAVAGQTPLGPEAGTPQDSLGPKKRLRQSTKPLLNQLETDFLPVAQSKHPGGTLWCQALTFRLANGLRYTPDFSVIDGGFLHCYETKGKWIDGDSIPKLKMAASVYPDVYWYLAWKDPATGAWQYQRVLA